MSSFCRHRRLEATCPICSRRREQEARPKRAQRAGPAAQRKSRPPSAARRRSTAGDVRIRKLVRAAGDDYSSPLVPGLRASADAELLARELAFSAARLEQLGTDAAPGLYGEAARMARGGEREEALWLLFLIALVGPSAGPPAAAFAQIERVRVRWGQADRVSFSDVALGPRGARNPASAAEAYRAWATRSGGQAAALAGDRAWSPERRFDRAFERLALAGLGRAQRYEYLLCAGAAGAADLRAASLHLLSDPRDPALAAAKRVFGIADPLLIARRAGDLACACGLPLATLDLALLNWARLSGDSGAERITCGCAEAPDPGALESSLAALGIAVPD